MKDINYYLGLPYTILLRRDDEGDFVARIDQLPGCSAHGKTTQDALDNLAESQRLWIQDCIESGQAVPEPTAVETLPSGKWVQRVPRSLHKRLTSLAKQEAVSLNQLVTSMLAQAVGISVAPELAEGSKPDAWATRAGSLVEEARPDWLLFQSTPTADPNTRTAYLATLRRFGRSTACSRTGRAQRRMHAHEEAYEINR